MLSSGLHSCYNSVLSATLDRVDLGALKLHVRRQAAIFRAMHGVLQVLMTLTLTTDDFSLSRETLAALVSQLKGEAWLVRSAHCYAITWVHEN